MWVRIPLWSKGCCNAAFFVDFAQSVAYNTLMIGELTVKIPKQNIAVAVSGGVDSMVAVHWLMRGRFDFKVVHVNHSTPMANRYEIFVSEFCLRHQLALETYHVTAEPAVRQSHEDFWRQERYQFFKSQKVPVITAHHLDDVVETWIWSSLHGQSKTIPLRHANVVRPFLLWRKSNMLNFAERNNIAWIEDPTNTCTDYTRNLIRHELLPLALKVNPGLHKVVAKKIKQDITAENS